jgi:type I restriction enzyme M protein
MAADHNQFANLIWQIADMLRGPYLPPQYKRVMLPLTVLRRFDCVLEPTKAKVVSEYERAQGGKLSGDALDTKLNKVAGQRFHNHSPLDFAKLKGDPDNINKHLVSYIKGFSNNVQRIFDFFEFEAEIEKMHEANILYLVVSKIADVDLHPSNVPNEQMGLIFENLIRRFNELDNTTAGDHFTPREVVRLMVDLLFIHDDKLLATPGTVRKLLDPACGTGGMLAEAQRYLREHNTEARLYAYGQDYNKPAFATAASDSQDLSTGQQLRRVRTRDDHASVQPAELEWQARLLEQRGPDPVVLVEEVGVGVAALQVRREACQGEERIAK